MRKPLLGHFKPYLFPSGRIDLVRGFEPFCLRDLLREGIQEDEILTGDSNMPTIIYQRPKKKRLSRYFPDILVGKNRIIEVKSPYTLMVDLEKNKSKFAKCLEMGYDMSIRVYNKRGELLAVITSLEEIDRLRPFKIRRKYTK